MMRRWSTALAMALGVGGCSVGAVEGTRTVTLELTLEGEGAAAQKETLQARLIQASDLRELPLRGARARVDGAALHLELEVQLDEACTPELAEQVRVRAGEILTRSGVVSLLEVSPEGAELLASALRERHQVPAQTPYDKPGLLVSQVSESVLVPLLEELGKGRWRLVTSAPGERWVAEVKEVVRGTDLARVRWEGAGRSTHVELTVQEDKVVFWRELTERVRGKPLLVMVNGRFLVAAPVGMRMTHGRWIFEVPGEAAALSEELAAMAASAVEVPLTLTQSAVRCGAREALAQ